MWCLAVKSPNCTVSTESAASGDQVNFTCSVTVCGNASVALNITRNGTTVKSGTNSITWPTTSGEVSSTDVKCSADFGDSDTCPPVSIGPRSTTTRTPSKFPRSVFTAYIVLLILEYTIGGVRLPDSVWVIVGNLLHRVVSFPTQMVLPYAFNSRKSLIV